MKSLKKVWKLCQAAGRSQKGPSLHRIPSLSRAHKEAAFTKWINLTNAALLLHSLQELGLSDLAVRLTEWVRPNSPLELQCPSLGSAQRPFVVDLHQQPSRWKFSRVSLSVSDHDHIQLNARSSSIAIRVRLVRPNSPERASRESFRSGASEFRSHKLPLELSLESLSGPTDSWGCDGMVVMEWPF